MLHIGKIIIFYHSLNIKLFITFSVQNILNIFVLYSCFSHMTLRDKMNHEDFVFPKKKKMSNSYVLKSMMNNFISKISFH